MATILRSSGWDSLLCGEGELEVLALCFVGTHRDRGRLRSQPLMPRGDFIGPRVEARDGELPVRAGHRVERIAEYTEVGAHPRMNVALDMEDRLRLGKGRRNLFDRGCHPLVESRIDCRKRVNVVED